MGDPDLGRADLVEGAGQLVPVGVVRDDQRQLAAALLGPGAHPHPARGHGGHRLGQAARPAVVQRRGRRQHDLAPEVRLVDALHGPELAQIDAKLTVQPAERLQGTVQIERAVVAGPAQQRDDPLRLAQAVDADQLRPVRIGFERGQQLRDLRTVGRMAEHRQAEGRLGDEDVAVDDLEGRTGRIRPPLVVARDHDAGAAPFQHRLRRTEDVAGRHQAQRHAVDLERRAVAERLHVASRPFAVARAHDGERLRRGEHRIVVGPRVVGVAMGDHRAHDRPRRVDVEIPWLAVEPCLGYPEPAFRCR